MLSSVRGSRTSYESRLKTCIDSVTSYSEFGAPLMATEPLVLSELQKKVPYDLVLVRMVVEQNEPVHFEVVRP